MPYRERKRSLMKLFLAFSLLTIALAHADSPAATSTADKPQSSLIPAGAVQVSPYLYSFTGNDGKKWFYRETPFGVMRYTEDQVAAPRSPAPDGISAFEDGNIVRFERLGPFGIYHWTKEKSALEPDEQAALERARAAAKRY
jgi:hypothetical protein